MNYSVFIIFFIISFAIAPTITLAKCPTHALNIKVIMNKDKLKSDKVFVEIVDKFGSKKMELQKMDQGQYQGLITFSTIGFVFLVEWSCSYLPEYVTIYVDDSTKKIELDWKDLIAKKRNNDTSEKYISYIFDVDIFL